MSILKYLITLSLLALLCMPSYSQSYIYMNDRQYEATSSWEFQLNASHISGNPRIAVVKNSNRGYLLISIGVPFQSNYIGGNVTLFLNDGSTITCFDRGIRDHVNDRSKALYYFTSSEIERLKEHRITRIRFSIVRGSQGERAYTADNYKPGYVAQSFRVRAHQNYHPTDTAVRKLFD